MLDKKFEEKFGSVGNREKGKDAADSQIGTENHEDEKIDEKDEKLEDEDGDEDEDEGEDEDTPQKEQQKSKPNINYFAESVKEFQKVCSLFPHPSAPRSGSQFQWLSSK